MMDRILLKLWDWCWMAIACVVFGLGVLLVLILLPIEWIWYKLHPIAPAQLNDNYRRDPNAGDD